MLKMFVMLKHNFALGRKITPITFKCFFLQCIDASCQCDSLERLTDEKWTDLCCMTFGEERHHYVPCACAWPIPALLSRCNHIVCKHDSAWGKDHHVSVHMLSKRVFFSTWKLAHFTLKQCFWNNIVKKVPCSLRAWGVSVHMLSNRVFFSTWKFAHFTLKQCFWNNILRKVACSLRAWFLNLCNHTNHT